MRREYQKKNNGKSLYRYEPWSITEDKFTVENNHHNEAIFSLANGYMGMRGTFEEDYLGPNITTTPGMYINGVYGSEKIIYGETVPNMPSKGQTMLNVADWANINLYVDNDKLDLLRGKISNYNRVLDMEKGVLRRQLIWTSSGGKKISFNILRCLSQSQPHLGMIIYKFKPLNFSGSVKLVTGINGNLTNYHNLRNKKALSLRDSGFTDNIGFIIQKAKSTSIYVAMATKNIFKNIKSQMFQDRCQIISEEKVLSEYDLKIKEGEEYSLQRYVYVYTSLEFDNKVKGIEYKLREKVIKGVNQAANKGSKDLLQEHFDFIKEYWNDVDIKISGDIALQQAFRFNAFQLLQSTGRTGKTNIPAKGLSGEFYEGHYFWDTETYIIPFFLYNRPEIAKNLLMYRYHNLDKARANAKRMKLDGALYPWRTINGEEASGFFMGSTVQYHINADIAYAIHQYLIATEDKSFLYKYGAEILLETARMWFDRGDFIPLKDNKFCINEVCGPDEYNPGVNNNCYTNYMAKFNLELAIKVLNKFKKEEPILYGELKEKVGFQETEISKWEIAAENIYLPFNKELSIHPQDDTFLFKKTININSIPQEEIPLVRNWHPLIIWRYQLIKQADVLLLMLLLGNHFTFEEKKANYDYYEPRTTHDSSLSPAIHSIIANEIGYLEDAYNYFMMTARLDLDDYNKNTYQGLHTACMAGSWLALIQGFAGMRNYDGKLCFFPKIPQKWGSLGFKIKFCQREIKIVIKSGKTQYRLISGKEIRIVHKERELLLIPGKEVEVIDDIQKNNNF